MISSDDRLKHNEETLINPLEIIRQLNPQKYQKTEEMRGADFKGEVDTNFVTEAGFIAQEVKAIPELGYCVTGGDGEDSSGNLVEKQHYLNYNNLFTVILRLISSGLTLGHRTFMPISPISCPDPTGSPGPRCGDRTCGCVRSATD